MLKNWSYGRPPSSRSAGRGIPRAAVVKIMSTKKTPSPAWNIHGFTLLEVMVAMAILGIGLLVLIQLFSQGLHSVTVSEDYTKAAVYAREKMTEVLTSQKLPIGLSEGLSENDRFHWKVEVIPSPTDVFDDNPPFLMYKVKVGVTWEGRFGEKGIQLETLKTIKKNE